MKASYKFEGGKEMSAALAELGKEATKAGEYAARSTAKLMQADLIAAAPRDERAGGLSERYGHLSENIKVVKVRPRKADRVIYRVGIGAAFWGYIVEFGSAKMAARPWWRPTVDANHQGYASAQTGFLRKGIDLAVRRAERKLLKRGGQ